MTGWAQGLPWRRGGGGGAKGRSRWLPRTLKVTREGRYYLGLTFGVGFAAVNTGNNLLFLTLGMLLSLIILSGLLSEAALGRLTITRQLPVEARAGEPVRAGLVVQNGNRVLPSVGLVFEELGADRVEAAPARLFQVGAGRAITCPQRLVPRERGWVPLEALRVTTAYPFGIFAKTRVIEVGGRFVAWPARARAALAEPDPGDDQAVHSRGQRGGGEDLHGLRPYRRGDDARLVHWRTSLRLGALVLIERDRPEGQRVTLTLGAAEGEAFEEAIRVAAAQAELHLERGDEVAIEAPGARLGFGRSPAHYRRLMTLLALLPPGGAPPEEAEA